MSEYSDEQILAAAKAGHEAHRAFCVAIGDNSQVTWEWAESQQRESAIVAAKAVNNSDYYGRIPRQKLNDDVFIQVVKAVFEVFDQEAGV